MLQFIVNLKQKQQQNCKMTVRLRVPDNKEPVFFVWDLPDFTTKICSKFPIGSKELQTLLEVSQHLHAVVYDIYRKNVQDILKQYANYETPLNRIVLSISTRPNLSLNSVGDISHTQQFMILQVKALGIPCPNKHLGLEDIPRLNQALEDRNLQKIWGSICLQVQFRQQALDTVGKHLR